MSTEPQWAARVGKLRPAKRSSSRGVAMVEALMATPVLVLLWAGILFLHHLGAARQKAEMEARTCAWIHSENSCDESRLPSECKDLLSSTDDDPGDENRKVQDQVTETLDSGAATVSEMMAASDERNAMETLVFDILRPALKEMFARSMRMTQTRGAKRPPLLGGKSVEVKGSHHLACNLEARDPLDLAAHAWDLFQ